MRRPYTILLVLGLLAATGGCHHTHGVCDCDLGPVGHDGPPPVAPLLRPVPAQPMPKAAEPIAPPAPSDTSK